MSFTKGDRARIKTSEGLHELGGAEVEILDTHIGVYPNIEGAT